MAIPAAHDMAGNRAGTQLRLRAEPLQFMNRPSDQIVDAVPDDRIGEECTLPRPSLALIQDRTVLGCRTKRRAVLRMLQPRMRRI